MNRKRLEEIFNSPILGPTLLKEEIAVRELTQEIFLIIIEKSVLPTGALERWVSLRAKEAHTIAIGFRNTLDELQSARTQEIVEIIKEIEQERAK